MDSNADSIPQVSQCPTCLLIRIRDVSQEPIPKTINEAPPSDAGPITESELASYSKPFELEYDRHPTISYEAALDFFHGEPCGKSGRCTSVCILCDHWVNGIFTREWGDSDPIARVTLGTLTEIEARSECIVCRFLCQTVSQSPFTLDNTRTLALELGRTPHVRSCKYRAAGAILYEDVEEFQHLTEIDKKYPQLTVFNKNDIMPDFTNAEVNWERLRQWYTDLAGKTYQSSSIPRDKNSSISDALPKGFCLISVSEACLIETDGVQVPNYAALSYVWGKSDEEIITTTNNFESLKLPGRFREKDVPVLFRDAFKVCSQLGIDYFWIDRICVVQDDEKRKSAQLEAMGRIYSKACFTIVSSEPHFINQGLPGVSQPRTPPLNLLVGDKVLLPRIHGSNKSTWKTRGWTYQEGLLSENVLIFGQDTVYMYSRGSDKLTPEGFQEFSYDKPDYISSSLVPQDEEYSDQVHEYSTRLLTFGSDKVNAFLGVLNSFGEHQYGLPHTILDRAMLWNYTYEPSRSGPRVPGQEFPSWSWVSTVGRIEYRHLPSKDRPLFSVATWAILQLDEASNKPLIKVLDDLQPGEQSEALHHLNTIRSHISPLEARAGYDPVAIAMAANLCERYRLIQEVLNRKEPSDGSETGPTAGENKTAESIWLKMIAFFLKLLLSIFGSEDKSLSQVRTRMKPFKKALWFQALDDSIRQVPEQVRVETLLRIAKPSLPNLLQRFSAVEVEAALKPGRIMVHAPKRTVQLKYTQQSFKGTHIWMIGHSGKLIGMAELSEPRHQEVLASMSQDASQDQVEAHCIALSLMACRVRYTERGRQDYSSTENSHSTLFAMIVSLPSMSCSRRLGLGFIDYSEWSSLGEVPIETTILS